MIHSAKRNEEWRTSDRRMAFAVERWARDHQDELIRDLKGLIAIPSIAHYSEGSLPMGTGCKQALSYMHTLAEQYGFAVENGNDHYITISSPGSLGQYELGLLGHADVVPAGTGWKYDPFFPIEKNGYVIGRGALDNKGPVIMALYTMRALCELGITLSGNLKFIIGCDEEQEMRDVKLFLSKHQPPAFTLNVDGKWPVCIGEKGILNVDLLVPCNSKTILAMGGGEASNTVPASAWVKINGASTEQMERLKTADPFLSIKDEENGIILHSSGKAAHASSPSNGENAIRRLFQILSAADILGDKEKKTFKILCSALRDDYGTGLHINHADRLSGAATCVPTQIAMHSAQLCVHLNIRYGVTQNSAFLLRKLHSVCEQLGLKIDNASDSPPRISDVDQPEINLLIETCREFVSRRCQPYITAGGTHSRIFPNSIPFGPLMPEWIHRSRLGGPHQADEAVLIADLLAGIKVYATALVRLDRYYQKL